jgi:hypothetical protein
MKIKFNGKCRVSGLSCESCKSVSLSSDIISTSVGWQNSVGLSLGLASLLSSCWRCSVVWPSSWCPSRPQSRTPCSLDRQEAYRTHRPWNSDDPDYCCCCYSPLTARYERPGSSFGTCVARPWLSCDALPAPWLFPYEASACGPEQVFLSKHVH